MYSPPPLPHDFALGVEIGESDRLLTNGLDVTTRGSRFLKNVFKFKNIEKKYGQYLPAPWASFDTIL